MLRHRVRLDFLLLRWAPKAAGGAVYNLTNPLPSRQLDVCSWFGASRLSGVNAASKVGVRWCNGPYKSSIASTPFRTQHGLRGVITCP